MPTIDDIAKLADVSHGTVSNVLNKKGNVSVAKIQRVEEAARALGFKLNAQAKLLRQGQSNRVVLIVPHCKISRYIDLYAGLHLFLHDKGYSLEFFQTGDYPHEEEQVLEEAASFSPAAIVLVSSQVKSIMWKYPSIPLIFFERTPELLENNTYAFRFDLEAAGKEIAERCMREGRRSLAIFTGMSCYSDSRSFLHGLATSFEENLCNYTMYSCDHLMTRNVAFNIIERMSEYDAIITSDREKAQSLQEVAVFLPQATLPPIYTLTSTSIIPSSLFISYELNYRYGGNRVGQLILDILSPNANNKTETTRSFKLVRDAFHDRIGLQKRAVQQRLNMLSIANPTSSALKKLLPSFTQETGIEVKLVEVTYGELYKEAKKAQKGSIYDLIRLDMVWLGDIGSSIYQPIDLGEEPYISICDAFSKTLPREYFYADRTCYSLPFDISVQLLLYRKDLFDDALIRRKYYETQKKHLKVPATYTEYLEVARFFTRSLNPDSPTAYGTSLVFGSAIVAACDFLPRLKASGLQSIFNEQGKVVIDTPLVRETLQTYIDTFACTNRSLNYWWQDAMEEFSEGKTAMIPVFSNYASTLVHSPNTKLLGNIGFAPLPGNKALLGGGIIGITKGSEKIEACKTFLSWIYEQKTANMITYLGGYIHSASLHRNQDLAELYPWTLEIHQALANGWRSEPTMNEMFVETAFEEILGGAVRAAVTGVMSIEEALSDAQQKCDSEFLRQ